MAAQRIVECRACNHTHADVCTTAMVDEADQPKECGCPPPCPDCEGQGVLSVPASHYEDADFDCYACDGTGEAQ